jgi:hypothetical protein
VSCLSFSSASADIFLKKEAICSSETSDSLLTTRRYGPEVIGVKTTKKTSVEVLLNSCLLPYVSCEWEP